MISRHVDLLCALAGDRTDDQRLSSIVDGLSRSGIEIRRVADAITDGAERAFADSREAHSAWIAATSTAASVASVLAAIGLHSMYALLFPFERSTVHLVPLFALLMLAPIAFVWARQRTSERRVIGDRIAAALEGAGVARSLAREAGAFVAGSPPPSMSDRLGVVEAEPSRWPVKLLPGMMAAYVVLSFWLMYIAAIAQAAVKDAFLE